DPAVHADLVPAVGENGRNHLRMEQVADGGDEEGRGKLIFVEQAQDARHAVDRAVLAARDRFGDQVSGGEVCGRIVDVEAETDGHTRAIGPCGRLQAAYGADMKHLGLELLERKPRTLLVQ